MLDKTHTEFVTKWANFVKDNPPKIWRPILNEFIDAQYDMHYQFIERLKKTKNSREKIIKLYNIKNLKGYKKLLN